VMRFSLMFLQFCSRVPLGSRFWCFTLVSLALHSAFQLKPLAWCACSRFVLRFRVELVSPAFYSCPSPAALRSCPLCAYC